MLLAFFFVIFTIALSICLPIGLAYPFIIKNIYSKVATFHFSLVPLYAFITLQIQIFLLKRTNSIPDGGQLKSFRDHSLKKNLDSDSYLQGFKFALGFISLMFSILSIAMISEYNITYQYKNYRAYSDAILVFKDTYMPYTGKYQPVTKYRLHLLLPIKEERKKITIDVSDGEYEIYKIGDKIPIIYSEKDPSIFRLK